MTVKKLKTAFYCGYCIGINRAYEGGYAPHWFWLKPHRTLSLGLIPQKRGWNSYNESHVWEQVEREPEKWVIGQEVGGKFQPLKELFMTANEMFKAFEEKGYCIGRNKGTRERPLWFWIAPHECCAGCVAQKFGFGRDYEQYVLRQIKANPQDWVLGRAIDGKFQPLDEV